MTHYDHQGSFLCPDPRCHFSWKEDRNEYVEFPYYDQTGVETASEECPKCKLKGISGDIVSTEDLDFDENMRASVIEGRSDQENGR